MKPTSFPESNCEIAKDQPEYQTLPAHLSDNGIITTCWKLTDEEILSVLENGCFWFRQMTLCNPMQPILPSVEKPEELA